ncbi:quinolinate synthase NadA [Candidatus Woesearchaeota archaeon]|nr:quinolinate synthase NadA [Candidatus Woesearchaeota archaeon]
MQFHQKTDDTELIKAILELKRKKNAVILAHNYQRPEMYEIADFIGDSLDLSQEAAKTDADIILFCGVKFMAETAKILSPDKTVLIPALEAGCSLADMAGKEQLIKTKKLHPDAAAVSYVNSSAEIKAMSDVCCTSMNAVKIANSLPHKEIIFLPDRNLGEYVAKKTDKKIILWDGYCFVHDRITAKMLLELKEKIPDAKVIAHPECREEVLQMADHISGTGGMAKFAKSSNARDFIVATECGMIEKLKRDIPNKNFYSFNSVCNYMKLTTLPLAADALTKNQYQVTLPQDIMEKAKRALGKMLELS